MAVSKTMDMFTIKDISIIVPENLASKIEEVISSGKHGYTSVLISLSKVRSEVSRDLGYLV
jgi:hypothetical protein